MPGGGGWAVLELTGTLGALIPDERYTLFFELFFLIMAKCIL